MSMLDSFFNKGFRGAKCKTLLKLTIPRIKLLRNKREIQLKQMRRDIAKLLENGQEATARIRVEHIIREENMMAAQEIIELFCELIAVRLPIIETQRECPLDLKEAISSICFAAPRCSDLPELQQVQMLFASKYGREFVSSASELMPDCGVNRQIIELLSVRAPSVEAKLKLLKEIAEEHEVDWDPAACESEFLKPHEDLLNGPNHIISGSTLPLPNEKHEDSISSENTEKNEEFDSDPGFDSLDLPEVPKVSVRAAADDPSAPEISPSPIMYSPPSHLNLNPEHIKATPSSNEEPEPDNPEPSMHVMENRQFQFAPFVASPPSPSISSPSRVVDPSPSLTSPPPGFPSKHSDPTPPLPHDPAPFLASPPHVFHSKHSEPTPSLSNSKTEADIDFQDVLEAAQAAAESAEKAARAARAAASLAQVRITELVTKKNDRTFYQCEKNGSPEAKGSDSQDVIIKPTFDQQDSFGYADHVPHYEPAWGLGSTTLSCDDVPKMMDGSPDTREHNHQPQRSASIEDDPYFSYPNLFSRQDSGLKPDTYSSAEHPRPPQEF
ncbi:uncharacterized protein M6B38_198740 [Iris pallida]|uniref:IST1-like protein n=1 Tax=Iris pallida TaxID=29817 RepID=A0AAX6EAW4_IRIPA|nr:uncharacterized protein M6B38_198740 [Iris pallida]